MYRTHTCGALRPSHVDTVVKLCGWVQRMRHKGKILWLDLRDRHGITQIVLEEKQPSDAKRINQVKCLGREYVIWVEGIVGLRTAPNPQLLTGQIEVRLHAMEVLNPAHTPPFLIEEPTDGKEELRMQYRYLDLRRAPLQHALATRHKLMQAARSWLHPRHFIEVETPLLIKSTPEGARDFTVASHAHPGQYYALPQSPQLLKQLLMVGGLDRYYQFARCFRDEDLRADRQPEFTQLDCELSFVKRQDILEMFESLLHHLFAEVAGTTLPPFQCISYDEAIRRYGSDKPDLRFGLELIQIEPRSYLMALPLFDTAELILSVHAPGCASYSRKQLDALAALVKRPQHGASGLVWVKYTHEGHVSSSVDKFFEPAEVKRWLRVSRAQPGDLILLVAGKTKEARQSASALRLELGERLSLYDSSALAPLWVIDFPMFVWDSETAQPQSVHHPFTAPHPDDAAKLAQTPLSVRSEAYDLVLNGVEIGGGSIRIHQAALQRQVLQLLGMEEAAISDQFGFLIKALEYGAPPHGGIALGFDRLCTFFAKETSIRSCIAFPKNSAGRDLTLGAPSPLPSLNAR